MKFFLIVEVICAIAIFTLLANHAASAAEPAGEEIVPTTAKPLPVRIRDSFLTGIRNVGTAIRYVPATLTNFFRNVSKNTQAVLRPNNSVVLIPDATTTTPVPTTTS